MRRQAVALTLVVLVATACTRGYEEAADVLDPSSSATPAATPSPSGSPSGSPAASPSPTRAPIEIRTPIEGDAIASPVVVSGTARSSSGEIVVRIIGADRWELASIVAPVDCGASCAGRYRVALAFSTPGLQAGAVQVFELGSAGSAEHLVEVAVTLTPGA